MARYGQAFKDRAVARLLPPRSAASTTSACIVLYSAANLAVRKRNKIKRPASGCVPLQMARTVNDVWRMDFVSDSLANGRRLKCPTVADDIQPRMCRHRGRTSGSMRRTTARPGTAGHALASTLC